MARKSLIIGILFLLIGYTLIPSFSANFKQNGINWINKAPFPPSDPSPANFSNNVSLLISLSVLVRDPDDDKMDVYFFDASDGSLIEVANNVKSGDRAFCGFTLPYDQFFTWYVIASDGEFQTRGPLSGNWIFSTKEDTDKPVVVISSPRNITIVNEQNISVEGYADDMLGIDNFYITHIAAGFVERRVLINCPKNHMDFCENFTLKKGNNKICISATDFAGNNGENCINIVYIENKIIYVDDDNTEGPWNGTKEYPFQYIQEGIDAAVDGETVFVFQGHYNANLFINKGIYLIGEERNYTIIDGNNFSDVIFVEANNVTIQEFKIINSGSYYDNELIECDAGIDIRSNDVTVSDCTFNSKFLHIFDLKSTNNVFSHNLFQNESGVLLSFSSNCLFFNNKLVKTYGLLLNELVNSNITDNHFNQNYIFSINLWNSSNNIISNNHIFGNKSYGVLVRNSDENDISMNTISIHNQSVYDVIWEPFYLENSNNNSITENHVYGSRWNGMTFIRSNYNKIFDNLIRNNHKGMVFLRSSNNFLSENVFDNNSERGIYLYTSSKFNTIMKNIVKKSSIVIVEESSNNKIISNDVSNCVIHIRSDNNSISNNLVRGYDGVFLREANYNEISENKFYNNIRDGIHLEDFSTNNKILKNKISENGNNGIFLCNSCDNNSIFGNTILKNKEFGIYLEESSNNFIKSNNFMFNEKDVFFELCSNVWHRNYWNRPRLLPFSIEGETSTEIDRYPRLLPYDIFGWWKL